MDAVKRIIIEFDNIEITGRDIDADDIYSKTEDRNEYSDPDLTLTRNIDLDDVYFEPEDPNEYSDPDLTLTFDTDLGIWKNGNGSKVSNTHMENVEVKFRLIKRMREITERD